jgi:hypothetical protein
MLGRPDDLDDARRRDRLAGLLVITLVFFACLGFTYWAERVAQPEHSVPPAPPTSEGITGWPKAVDPLRQLDRARGLTRRALLRRAAIDRVNPTGTVDVTARGTRAAYLFQSAPGEGPQPVHEPGTLPRRHFCGKQQVVLDGRGIGAEPDVPAERCPPHFSDALPDPQCTLREVFKRAVELGADPATTADIQYYRARVGPAWRFEQRGRATLWIYGDCGRSLTVAEAADIHP